ncbi:hypothetical protein, partial [Anaplasma phagocytophilum]|uniref:hypothetical protein n=1 Tax=Anaplasma phagocytophilum TaxID=948 RepID=UPI00201AB573
MIALYDTSLLEAKFPSEGVETTQLIFSNTELVLLPIYNDCFVLRIIFRCYADSEREICAEHVLWSKFGAQEVF